MRRDAWNGRVVRHHHRNRRHDDLLHRAFVAPEIESMFSDKTAAKRLSVRLTQDSENCSKSGSARDSATGYN
jgi:hypothetical protein